MKNTIVLFLILFLPQLAGAQVGYIQEGKASFYADKFEGRTTASGERYSHSRSTCAHLTLPFGTLVKVTNLANNQSVVVRVNDRGPFVPNRIIDLSRSAAEKIDFIKVGVVDVRIEVIDNEGNSIGPPPATITQIALPANQTQQPSPPPVKPAQTVSAPTPRPSVPTSAPAAILSETELYELKVNRQNPSGFTVQIGSYKELVNLLRIADDLKSSLKRDVRVQVATINNEKIYRLMVGEFTSRRDAEEFKNRAAQLYPDCFIVELK